MKRVFALIVFVLAFSPAFPQRFIISPNIGGGLHGLYYKTNGQVVTNSKQLGENMLSFNIGYKGGIGIQYFFDDKEAGQIEFGLGLGVEAQMYSLELTLNSVESFATPIIYNAKQYQHRTYFNNLKERQDFLQYSVPLGIFFQIPCYREKKFWQFGIGVQADYIFGKYKTVDGFIETRLFEPNDNVEFYNIPRYNLDKYDSFKGDYSSQLIYSGFGVLGIYFNAVGVFDVGFNIYGTYSLTPIFESVQQTIYQPNFISENGSDIASEYHSVLNSNHIAQSPHVLSAGLSLILRVRLD